MTSTIEENVVRFDIAMQYAVLVNRVESSGDWRQPLVDLVDCLPIPALGQSVGERSPCQVLQHRKRKFIVIASLVD